MRFHDHLRRIILVQSACSEGVALVHLILQSHVARRCVLNDLGGCAGPTCPIRTLGGLLIRSEPREPPPLHPVFNIFEKEKKRTDEDCEGEVDEQISDRPHLRKRPHRRRDLRHQRRLLRRWRRRRWGVGGRRGRGGGDAKERLDAVPQRDHGEREVLADSLLVPPNPPPHADRSAAARAHTHARAGRRTQSTRRARPDAHTVTHTRTRSQRHNGRRARALSSDDVWSTVRALVGR